MKILNIFLASLMLASTACASYIIPDNSVTAAKLNTDVFQQDDKMNLGLNTSVATNQLTVTVTRSDGSSAPTSLRPVKISYRSGTSTAGSYSALGITSSISITIPSGTTLGTVSGVAENIFVYTINNGGASEVALSVGTVVDTTQLVSTTAISGGTTRGRLYSTTARSNVAARLVGKLIVTEGTAGIWATNASVVSLNAFAAQPPTYTILTSGSGTYTLPPNVKYIRVKIAGGGGGGGGGSAGSAGNSTTFGSSCLTAAGGSGGSGNTGGIPPGGSMTNSGTCGATSIISLIGSSGTGGGGGNAGACTAGGPGGATFFGGAGGGGPAGSSAGSLASAQANTGSGGGGGGCLSPGWGGASGGGSGGYGTFQFNSPAASYAYSIGTGGAGGASGIDATGGDGAAGKIEIEEFYQ